MPAETQFEPDEDEVESGEDSKLVKDLRRQLKEQSKRESDQTKQLAELTARERQRTLSEALTTKGLSPKLAKFYPADAETTDDAIDGWLTENAEAFGTQKVTTDTPAPPPGEGEQEKPADAVVDPASEWAYRRMAAASLVGGTATTREQDVLRQIHTAKNADELTALLRTARA